MSRGIFRRPRCALRQAGSFAAAAAAGSSAYVSFGRGDARLHGLFFAERRLMPRRALGFRSFFFSRVPERASFFFILRVSLIIESLGGAFYELLQFGSRRDFHSSPERRARPGAFIWL